MKVFLDDRVHAVIDSFYDIALTKYYPYIKSGNGIQS